MSESTSPDSQDAAMFEALRRAQFREQQRRDYVEWRAKYLASEAEALLASGRSLDDFVKELGTDHESL